MQVQISNAENRTQWHLYTMEMLQKALLKEDKEQVKRHYFSLQTIYYAVPFDQIPADALCMLIAARILTGNDAEQVALSMGDVLR